MTVNNPPMGWNSWNTFGPNINEKIVLETADAMVDKGYLDAGYEYLVIDDAWMMRERRDGKLVVNPEKFPHGMKFIGDYIHSKGLKFGIYSAAGTLTCQGLPGSYGHEFEDARQFADWGVDYLKYDLCHYPGSGDVKNSYLTMSMALRATGRDIVFSGCTVGEREPHTWMRSIGAHLYRSTGDIVDNLQSIRNNAMSQLRKLYSSAPGCYNDVDMLVVGMSGNGHVSHSGGCTNREYLLHFAMWCLWGAPLMMGCDIRNLDEECRAILQNKELIRIDQDAACCPPYYEERQRYAADGRLGFIKLLSDGDIAMAYFNFSDNEDLMIPFYFDDYGIPSATGKGLDITDVLTGEHIGIKHDFFCPVVPMQDFRLYRAKIV